MKYNTNTNIIIEKKYNYISCHVLYYHFDGVINYRLVCTNTLHSPPKFTLLTHETEWRIYASVNKPSLVQVVACRRLGRINAVLLLIELFGTSFGET